jgi:hypothetical protein
MRRFDPLPAGSPFIGEECWFCRVLLKEGDELALFPIRPEELGSHTWEARPVHSSCADIQGYGKED